MNISANYESYMFGSYHVLQPIGSSVTVSVSLTRVVDE